MKITEIKNPCRPWWPGDKRVEEFMPKVMEAIKRHITDRDAITDIYNRAYEAVYEAMAKQEKQKHLEALIKGHIEAMRPLLNQWSKIKDEES